MYAGHLYQDRQTNGPSESYFGSVIKRILTTKISCLSRKTRFPKTLQTDGHTYNRLRDLEICRRTYQIIE